MKVENIIVFNAEDLDFEQKIKNYSLEKDKNAYKLLVLPRDKFFIKKIEIPNCKLEEIKNVLNFEAEKYFFIDKEELILEYSAPFLIAVRKEEIEKYLNLFKKHKVTLDQITFRSKAFDQVNTNSSNIYLFDDFAEINFFDESGLITSRVVREKDLDAEYELTSKAISKKGCKIANADKFKEAGYIQEFNFLPQEILNFIEKKKKFRKIYQIGGVAVFFIILTAFYIGHLKYKNMQSNKLLTEKIKELKPEIGALEKMQKRIGIVENFTKNNISNLDILKVLSENPRIMDHSIMGAMRKLDLPRKSVKRKTKSIVMNVLDSRA